MRNQTWRILFSEGRERERERRDRAKEGERERGREREVMENKCSKKQKVFSKLTVQYITVGLVIDFGSARIYGLQTSTYIFISDLI